MGPMRHRFDGSQQLLQLFKKCGKKKKKENASWKKLAPNGDA